MYEIFFDILQLWAVVTNMRIEQLLDRMNEHWDGNSGIISLKKASFCAINKIGFLQKVV